MTPAISDLVRSHLRDLETARFAAATIAGRKVHLDRCVRWMALHGTLQGGELGPISVDNCIDALTRHRTPRGSPLNSTTIASFLTALRQFLRWGCAHGHFRCGLADRLGSSRMPDRLPSTVLSAREVTRILALPPLTQPMGLRDRAMLEVIYSLGIRRTELTALELEHFDRERAVVYIKDGKGRRDRVLPVSPRLAYWLERYLRDGRPRLARADSPHALFLGARGARVRPKQLTNRLHEYVRRGGSGKSGSCHIFRHTAATLMHDRGADIRDLQQWLGHRSLSTTQLYTVVSVRRLRDVHRRTHPCHALRTDEQEAGDRRAAGGEVS
jgi:integrase/recombinase XerD